MLARVRLQDCWVVLESLLGLVEKEAKKVTSVVTHGAGLAWGPCQVFLLHNPSLLKLPFKPKPRNVPWASLWLLVSYFCLVRDYKYLQVL